MRSNCLKKASIFALILSFTSALNAQVLFQETFDEANGSSTGSDAGINWTGDCPTCLAGDYWEVLNGVFEGNDTNGEANWTTDNAIDISTCGFIEISFDIESVGTMEPCGTGCNSVDWVSLQYDIDGSGWLDPTNSYMCAGACAGVNVVADDETSTTYSTGCIPVTGNDLLLKITVQCWSGSEFWQIDNVTVTCSNPDAGTGNNINVCASDPPISLFSSLLGTPDNGGVWSGPSALTGGDQGMFDPSSAVSGIYTYTVGTAPCVVASNMVVSITAAGDPTIIVPPSFCENQSAINLVAATGGGVWSGVGITNATTGTFDPGVALAGSHEVIYTLSGGCGAADTIFITVDQQANAGIDGSGSYCVSDPIVDLSTLVAPADPGGVWIPGLSSGSGVFNPATDPGGTYLYIVNGQGACLNDTSELIITVISGVNATINAAGPFCISDPTFTLSAATGGGTWAGLGVTNSATGDFDPATAGAGIHEIIYTIAGSCGGADTISLSVSAIQDATINPQADVCETSGILTLSALNPGGVWGGLGIVNTTTGTFDPASVGPGFYTVTYSFGGGCPTSETVTFSVLPDATPTISPPSVLCLNTPSFLLSSNVVGGIWTGSGIVNGITGDFNPAFAGLGAHEIIYTVSGACGGADTINVTIADIPVATTSISDSLGCPVLLVTADYVTSSTIIDCIWTSTSGLNVNSCGPSVLPFSASGCFDLTLTLTDANGCVNSFTHPSQICVLDAPVADFTYLPQNPNELQPEVTFSSTSIDATTFDWEINNDLFATDNVTYSFPNSGQFDACLIVSNTTGCTDTSCVTVDVEGADGIYIANSFTPNGDGRNDDFMPSIFGFSPIDYKFEIYNRWGNKVWSSTEYGETWDGKVGVGSVSFKVPTEVYVWVLSYLDPNDTNMIRKRGHVTVLR